MPPSVARLHPGRLRLGPDVHLATELLGEAGGDLVVLRASIRSDRLTTVTAVPKAENTPANSAAM